VCIYSSLSVVSGDAAVPASEAAAAAAFFFLPPLVFFLLSAVDPADVLISSAAAAECDGDDRLNEADSASKVLPAPALMRDMEGSNMPGDDAEVEAE